MNRFWQVVLLIGIGLVGCNQTPQPSSVELAPAAVSTQRLLSGVNADPSISSSGRYVVYASVNSQVYLLDRQAGSTEMISVSSGGTQGNSVSYLPSVSSDGRYVVFRSQASNLVPNDTNYNEIGLGEDLFLRDRTSNTTERVNISSNGEEAEDGRHVNEVRVSDNGRFVAFSTAGRNLVSNDSNGTQDVYLRDRQQGTTSLISVGSDGGLGDNDSTLTDFTPDGRYVVFQSSASNISPGDENQAIDIFVYDLLNKQTEMISVSSSGVSGNGFSTQGTISDDGRFVAFSSKASNLVGGDTNQAGDVFLHDRELNTTRRVSVSSTGEQANGSDSIVSSYISGNGNYVVWDSSASTLVSDDTNNVEDVFSYNQQSGLTERVSVSSTGLQGNKRSDFTYGSISPLSYDGNIVLFTSQASNFYSGDDGFSNDVFIRIQDGDTQTPQTITFTSTPPSNATVGGTYTVSATASSGLAVTFSSATTSVCTVSGSTVSFVAAGTCTVNATQAGNAQYNPAPTAVQTFTVVGTTKQNQTITFTSVPPSSVAVGGSYTVSATASSGLAVTFSSATSTVCTVSGSTVRFTAAGSCRINASQAGNASYNPAPTVSQTINVTSTTNAYTLDFSGLTSGRVITSVAKGRGITSTGPVTSSVSVFGLRRGKSGNVAMVQGTAKMLILSSNGVSQTPNATGGVLLFDFTRFGSRKVTVRTIKVDGTNTAGGTIRLYRGTELRKSVAIPKLGSGVSRTLTFNTTNVDRVGVILTGTGKVDDLVVTQ